MIVPFIVLDNTFNWWFCQTFNENIRVCIVWHCICNKINIMDQLIFKIGRLCSLRTRFFSIKNSRLKRNWLTPRINHYIISCCTVSRSWPCTPWMPALWRGRPQCRPSESRDILQILQQTLWTLQTLSLYNTSSSSQVYQHSHQWLVQDTTRNIIKQCLYFCTFCDP